MTYSETNKGAAVDHLSRMLAIPTDQIATTGDSPNDVLMFRKSELSIGMGTRAKRSSGKPTP